MVNLIKEIVECDCSVECEQSAKYFNTSEPYEAVGKGLELLKSLDDG